MCLTVTQGVLPRHKEGSLLCTWSNRAWLSSSGRHSRPWRSGRRRRHTVGLLHSCIALLWSQNSGCGRLRLGDRQGWWCATQRCAHRRHLHWHRQLWCRASRSSHWNGWLLRWFSRFHVHLHRLSLQGQTRVTPFAADTRCARLGCSQDARQVASQSHLCCCIGARLDLWGR